MSLSGTWTAYSRLSTALSRAALAPAREVHVPTTVRRRWPLTRSFAVISSVAMVVLGCALVWVTWSVMSQQSLRDGIATAETVTTYATETVPTDAFVLPANLDQAQKDAVARATSGFEERLVELRLWALDGS